MERTAENKYWGAVGRGIKLALHDRNLALKSDSAYNYNYPLHPSVKHHS